jgi:cysteine-rich repeat protein
MAKRFGVAVWLVMAAIMIPHEASAVQSKCLAGKSKCAATHVTKLLKCHQLAETPGRSTDPNFNGCIDKALVKLDGGLAPEKGCIEKLEGKTPNDCITFDDTPLIAAIDAACVDAIVGALDPPPLTQSKCGAGKKKCAAKKLKGLLKCHQLAETPGKVEDPNANGCTDKVRLKFDGGLDPTKGCFAKLEAKAPNDCEILGDTATVEGLIDDCVADLVARVETPTTTTTSTSTSSTSSTSTSSTSSTSTSSSSTSSTSTSIVVETTTSSTLPLPTTTSTTLPTTTSSSSTTSTTTTTSTSSSTSPVGCGNGSVGAGETCDDGNNSDNDACPADCRIAACTPLTTTQRFVQVRFSAPLGALVAGLTVLVDYPEGQVDLPGNGTTFPSGTISGVPPGSSLSVNDLNFGGKGHAVRVTIAGQSGNALPQGQIIRFRFNDCTGAVVPTADQFLCTVIAATDPFLNPVAGVRCFVVVE